jgi:hypothetical protein
VLFIIFIFSIIAKLFVFPFAFSVPHSVSELTDVLCPAIPIINSDATWLPVEVLSFIAIPIPEPFHTKTML